MLSVFLLWCHSCCPSFWHPSQWGIHELALSWARSYPERGSRWSLEIFLDPVQSQQEKSSKVSLNVSIYVSLWLPVWSLCISTQMILCVNPWIFLLWASLCVYSCVYTSLHMCIYACMFVFVLYISVYICIPISICVYFYACVCAPMLWVCMCIGAPVLWICMFIPCACGHPGIWLSISWYFWGYTCMSPSLSVCQWKISLKLYAHAWLLCVFNKGKDWEISTQSSSAPKLLCCYQTNP